MKVIYSLKAIEFIKKKNIKDIYIRPKFSGAECCGLSSVILEIATKPASNVRYESDTFDGISTKYDPSIRDYDQNPHIEISAIGFGTFKKLVTTAEFSSIQLD